MQIGNAIGVENILTRRNKQEFTEFIYDLAMQTVEISEDENPFGNRAAAKAVKKDGRFMVMQTDFFRTEVANGDEWEADAEEEFVGFAAYILYLYCKGDRGYEKLFARFVDVISAGQVKMGTDWLDIAMSEIHLDYAMSMDY